MASIEDELKTTFQSQNQKAALNVIFTGNWLQHGHACALKTYDLSPQQYNILRILRGARDKMSMNDIRCRMLDRTPNVTRLSDRLLEKELIERTRCDEDRRVVYVRITPQGLELLGKIDHIWERTAWPEHKLSEEEATLLNTILDKLRG